MPLDLSDFDAEISPLNRCKVCVLLGELTGDRKAQLAHVLKDTNGYPSAGIARAVTKWGHPVSDTTICNHRRKCQ